MRPVRRGGIEFPAWASRAIVSGAGTATGEIVVFAVSRGPAIDLSRQLEASQRPVVPVDRIDVLFTSPEPDPVN